MPNGGTVNCGNCPNLQDSQCVIRNVEVEAPHWTFCWSFGRSEGDVVGPLYAIVGEVRDRAVIYERIPYFDDIRVETTQRADGDTYLTLIDENGIELQFETTSEYLEYYKNTGRALT